MVKGLNHYNTQDRTFNIVFLYQGFMACVATSLWFVIANKYRLIVSRQSLFKSLPIVFVLNLYFTRGIANHLVAVKATQHKQDEAKHDNLIDYKNYLRNKNIID
jgi:hypothetical protein